MVVEAATEDLSLKQRLFAEVEALAGPDVPIASNTSNFQIGEIGRGLKHRGRVLGLHFFMPAHLVPLVEVVSSDATDPSVAESAVELMKRLGKAPIWVKKDIPGFVGNRIQHAMMREALYLIQDGIVSPEGVDTAVRYGFGFRFIACGPIMQKEMSGWDTNYYVASALYPHLYKNDGPPPIVKELVDKNHLGMKTKRGFWEWDDREDSQGKSAHREGAAGRDEHPEGRSEIASSRTAAPADQAPELRSRLSPKQQSEHGHSRSAKPGSTCTSFTKPSRPGRSTCALVCQHESVFACLPFCLIRVNAYWYYFGLRIRVPAASASGQHPGLQEARTTERKEASVTTQSSERESLSHLPGYVDERNRHADEAGLELEKQARKDGSLSTWFCGSEAQFRAARLLRIPEGFTFP